MSRRSTRRAAPPAAFSALSQGDQNGLKRLVSDHTKTVAEMLGGEETTIDVLCEKCAHVMKQQQLSVASFLARFFAQELLSSHALLCGKSGKGSESILGDRIATFWAQNKPFPEPKVQEEEATEPPKKKAKKTGKGKIDIVDGEGDSPGSSSEGENAKDTEKDGEAPS